jgi:hypothetical protein
MGFNSLCACVLGGGGAVLSCVYLKVFPPFFIQVVSVLEELNKYKRKKIKYMPEQI